MKTAAWLPHMLSATALTAALSLCLVSCSHEAEQTAGARTSGSPSSSAASQDDGRLHPGTFRARLPGGASVRITLPAAGTPDREIDGLRRDAKVQRATYATVEIDNCKGTSPISVSRLVLKMEDGASYQLEHVSRALEKWTPHATDGGYRAHDGSSMSEQDARSLKARLQDAGQEATRDVPVGKKDTNLLMGDIEEIPASFVSLELIPKIGDKEVPPVRVLPEGRWATDEESGWSGTAPEGREPDEDPAPGSTEDPADPADPVPDDPEPSADNPPVDPDPGVPDPADPDPVDPDPVQPQPGTSDPGVPDPVEPSPVDPAPTVTDASSPGPVVPTVPVVTAPDPADTAIPAPAPVESVPSDVDQAQPPAFPELGSQWATPEESDEPTGSLTPPADTSEDEPVVSPEPSPSTTTAQPSPDTDTTPVLAATPDPSTGGTAVAPATATASDPSRGGTPASQPTTSTVGTAATLPELGSSVVTGTVPTADPAVPAAPAVPAEAASSVRTASGKSDAAGAHRAAPALVTSDASASPGSRTAD